MSELRANTVSDAAGTGPVTLTGQYAAKAWVNFNGTGTVAIRESANVSSITDNGTGNYTVNFTNTFGDVNYAGVSGLQRVNTSDFVNFGFNRQVGSDQVEFFSEGVQADSATLGLMYVR